MNVLEWTVIRVWTVEPTSILYCFFQIQNLELHLPNATMNRIEIIKRNEKESLFEEKKRNSDYIFGVDNLLAKNDEKCAEFANRCM